LLVFGASGRTGREVVAEALARGLGVTAFVRNPQSLSPAPCLSVVQGDVLEPGAVEGVVEGADAVICCLGCSKRSPANLCSQVTANIVQAMLRHDVERLICQSGAMIGHPHLGQFYRLLKRLPAVRRQLEDRQLQEKIVEESGLNWTLVRPPRLLDGPATGRYRWGEHLPVGLGAAIRRKDLAAFMLDRLEDPQSYGRGLTIFH
jgi:putative NADH-flavin reductase